MQLTSRKRAIQKVLGVTEAEANTIMKEIQNEAEGLDTETIEEDKLDSGSDVPGFD